MAASCCRADQRSHQNKVRVGATLAAWRRLEQGQLDAESGRSPRTQYSSWVRPSPVAATEIHNIDTSAAWAGGEARAVQSLWLCLPGAQTKMALACEQRAPNGLQ